MNSNNLRDNHLCKDQYFNDFLNLSTILTGYNLVTLYGTGQTEIYFKTVKTVLGVAMLAELFSFFHEAGVPLFAKLSEKDKKFIKKTFLDHPQWKAVCHNITKMWYMGTWYQLPTGWRANYLTSDADKTHIVSADSYKEGLVWKAMGQHPQAAKQPGFGTWAFDPKTT